MWKEDFVLTIIVAFPSSLTRLQRSVSYEPSFRILPRPLVIIPHSSPRPTAIPALNPGVRLLRKSNKSKNLHLWKLEIFACDKNILHVKSL